MNFFPNLASAKHGAISQLRAKKTTAWGQVPTLLVDKNYSVILVWIASLQSIRWEGCSWWYVISELYETVNGTKIWLALKLKKKLFSKECKFQRGRSPFIQAGMV